MPEKERSICEVCSVDPYALCLSKHELFAARPRVNIDKEKW